MASLVRNTTLSPSKAAATKAPSNSTAKPASAAPAPAKVVTPVKVTPPKAATIQPAAVKSVPATVIQKPIVKAATPPASAVIATAKNPALFPTAVGGAMQGKVISAPGNASNQIVLAAWRASGGTTTNTYVDKFTNMDARGETALQEAARLQAAGTIKIFDKTAAAAGKPTMQVTNITGSNTTTAKKLIPAPPKPAPVINPVVSSGKIQTAGNIVQTPLSSVSSILATNLSNKSTALSDKSFLSGITNFFSSDPFKVVNPAILQTPEQRAQLSTLPAIVANPQKYIADQAKIKAMPTIIKPKPSPLDLTPGFNLGISDGSLLKKLTGTISDTVQTVETSVSDLLSLPGETIKAEKKAAATAQTGISALSLLALGAVAYLALKRK